MSTYTAVNVEAGDVTLSGRYRAAPGGARALIVALHGGTYSSKYYDSPDPSLFDFGPALGYSVLALDRPGYGAAASLPSERLSFDAQVPVLRRAVERAWSTYGQGSAGVFLLGHSIGGMLSLLVAAENPGGRILGLNMTGSGAVHHAQNLARLGSLLTDAPSLLIPPEVKAATMLGPAWTQAPAAGEPDPERDVAAPTPELRDSQSWPDRLPQAAAAAKVPVQFIVPEFDGLWRADPQALSHVPGMFTAAPFVDVAVQRFTGHSAEWHTLARAFYMKVFAFLEECIQFRARP